MEDLAPRSAYTQRFLDQELEAAYLRERAVNGAKLMRVGCAMSALIWGAAQFLFPFLTDHDVWSLRVVALALAAANLLGMGLSWHVRTMTGQQIVGGSLNALAGLGILALGWIAPEPLERLVSLGLLAVMLFAFVDLGLRFAAAVVATSPYVLTYLIGAIALGRAGHLAVDMLLVGASWLAGALCAYLLERASREVFAQRRVIEQQRVELVLANAKSERLLLNVLPAAVAARLKEREERIAERFDDATVLFADIVGFTPLSASMEPEQVVALLDELFTRFDALAERHGLEKIKTIGDAYMVAGGLPERRADHAEAVAAMGLDMVSTVAAFAREGGIRIDVRIGVHSGPVVAGVIGRKKFIYDLWGDTVNTASRMESHGVSGAVQITAATWDRIRHAFDAEAREPIDIKGKGPMTPLLLRGRRSVQA